MPLFSQAVIHDVFNVFIRLSVHPETKILAKMQRSHSYNLLVKSVGKERELGAET